MADISADTPAFRDYSLQARLARRAFWRQTALWGVPFAIAVVLSGVVSEVDPVGLLRVPAGLLSYIDRTIPPVGLATLRTDLADWFWGARRWADMLFQTLLMGWLATLLGCAVALPLSFVGARNLAPSFVSYFVIRRLFELWRAVPEIVYALIFIIAFGLGPLAGILAIAVHSAGALGKLYSEVCENVDSASLDGVRATGAGGAQTMAHAVFPQVLPMFLSYTLLRLEINVRSAAIIGFVGAGGIGQELFYVIRQFIFTDISAIVLMLIVVVSTIDMVCGRLRHSVIGVAR